MKNIILAILLVLAIFLSGCEVAEVMEDKDSEVMKDGEAMEDDAMEEDAMKDGDAMEDLSPSLSVSDQDLSDGTVTIDSATAAGPSWMVIHADNNGKPGTVIGFSAVSKGDNSNIVVEIDTELATPALFAMLHIDEGEVGVYEFPGADAPATDDSGVVVKAFSVKLDVMEETTKEVKEFTLSAFRYDFDPSTITVNEGDTVRLKITSTDTTHGFALSAFGINENLPKGKEVIIEFVADRKGSFPFACSVVCGSGHSGMSGILVVE